MQILMNKTGKKCFLVLLLVGCVLLLNASISSAINTCSYIDVKKIAAYCSQANIPEGDCDSDGFTDEQECKGFPSLYSTRGKRFWGYSETPAGDPDPVQLNPYYPDLMFLALDGSNNPLNPDGLLSRALQSAKNNNALTFYADNLTVNAHQISLQDVADDRLITGNRTRAALIYEVIDPNIYQSRYLGMTPNEYVTPSDPNSSSQIFTGVMETYVKELCSGQSQTCTIKNDPRSKTVVATNETASGLDDTPIINYYILQVVAHEMGHQSKLAPTDAASKYHYSRTDTVMDPAAIYKRGTFIIPTTFNLPNDRNALTIWQQ